MQQNLPLLDFAEPVALVDGLLVANVRPNGNAYLSAGGGDAKLAAQWSSPWLDWPHAARLEAKVPLYTPEQPPGQEGFFFPAPGDGQLDVTVWLGAGGSAGAVFGFAEVGHVFRTEVFFGDDPGRNYADGVAWLGQLGYDLFGVVLAVNVQGVAPYEADETTRGTLDLGPSVYARVGGGLALEARYASTLWARNASSGHAAGVGVSYDLR